MMHELHRISLSYLDELILTSFIRSCQFTIVTGVGGACLPQIVRAPLGQGWPVAEGVADDAGLVWSDPVTVELQRLRWPVQVGHRLVQVQI